jgi:high-affinity Fe2+/Pb2+ permease
LSNNDEKDGPVITATEARQGRITGLIWVLIFGLILAVIAGVVLLFLGNA